MRSEIYRLRGYQKQSKMVLDALISNDHSADILDQLRNGEELENITRRLENSTTATTTNRSPHDSLHSTSSSTPNITSSHTGENTPVAAEAWYERSPIRNSVEFTKHYGQQVILGDSIDSQDPLSHHGPKYNNEAWTTVTSDGSLVEHLLALYFCWEYPIFATVSKEHFMEDFRKKRPRYCSTLLVNALLALACRFSDQPNTRRISNDSTTAGDAFFEEALKLLNAENDRHVLTTIQALGVMSIREASCGRISESIFLSSQSIRLAIEMGLHVESIDYDTDDDDDSTENAIRQATFWGALSLNE
jgi:hypothetical protein